MRILHYSLGLPPFRTGGLTKFCTDLIKQQMHDGNEVALLWPGRMELFSVKTRIKNNGKTRCGDDEILNYEIINPLPVPYDEGIKDITAFTRETDPGVFAEFLDEFKPDVIHVHILMGMHKSFLETAKEKGIRLVYSAHDFFPICPKVTLFRKGHICDSAANCSDCATCNANALSLRKIQILQSPQYRELKDTKIVKALRKNHRDSFLTDKNTDEPQAITGEASDYIRLREHYFSMLALFDRIHFNSSLTESIFKQYYADLPSCVIPISHGGISDHRKEKAFSDEMIRIRYLGNSSKIKGFWMLKEALDKLWRKKQNFRLDVHFSVSFSSTYVIQHDRYNYSDLETIFDDTDVLVVPSVGYDTFGYTVLEALSYGVPVMLSENVGAKDIVADKACIIYNGDGLYHALEELDSKKLTDMNKAILSDQKILTESDMAERIARQCYC